MKNSLRCLIAGDHVRPDIRFRTIVWVLAMLWFPAQRLQPLVEAGEKPAIDRLFPPGGQRGTSVDVKFQGKMGDGPLQIWTEWGQIGIAADEVTADGEAAEKKAAEKLTLTIPEQATPGIHWLRFYNAFGAGPLKPFVVGILPEILETEPNNRLDEANVLESTSSVVNGVLEKNGDVDVFSVALKQGQTLLAAVQAHRVLGSPMDGVLQVLDDRGTILAHNDDDHGNDPLIAVRAPRDGQYYVRIFAFPDAPNSSIQFAGAATYIYRLTITTGPVVSHTIPLAVEAGNTAAVQLQGWNIPADLASVTVTASDPDAVPGKLQVAGEFAFPVSIDVVAHPSLSEDALEAGQPDLALPFAVTGRIDQRRQRDAFWFTGTKDQQLRCQVIARERYSMLDPVLSVFAEDGKLLKEADDISRDNPDSLLDIKLPADGRFRVEVRDRFDHAGERFFYHLRCTEITPDVTLSVKDHQFEMTSDKPLEIPVTIERKDGFALPLQLRVEGLPEGITSEPVRSEKDGDSAKTVTVKITGTSAAGFSGPIRIAAITPVETTSSDPATDATAAGLIRFAETSLGIADSRTSWMWLTIPATEVKEPPEKPAENG